MCGGVHNVITGSKFHQNRSRDFRATGVQKSGTPIDLAFTLTTVQHYRADCDMTGFRSFDDNCTGERVLNLLEAGYLRLTVGRL